MSVLATGASGSFAERSIPQPGPGSTTRATARPSREIGDMRIRSLVATLSLAMLLGCQENKPKGDLPPLHPAKGKVVRGGTPVGGGLVQFQTDPAMPDLIVNSEVKPDGTFELQTLHALSQKKAPGAPAGTYTVTYLPPATDQNIVPVIPAQTYPIQAGTNELTIDLAK